MLTDSQMQDMYKMVQDNNRMLHAMRRSAFLGGVFKTVFYLVFVIVPLWYTYQYISPLMNQMLSVAAGVQEGGASAQDQMSKMQDLIKQFQGLIPGSK